MPGPPKKTKAQLQASGSWRGDKRGEPPEPMALTSVEPPENLGPDGRRVWQLTVKWLDDQARLGETDLLLLERLCATWDLIKDCEAVLAKLGRTYQSGRSGLDMKERPEVKMVREGTRLFSTLAKEFGLTPTARNNLGITLPGNPNENRGRDVLAQYRPSSLLAGR